MFWDRYWNTRLPSTAPALSAGLFHWCFLPSTLTKYTSSSFVWLLPLAEKNKLFFWCGCIQEALWHGPWTVVRHSTVIPAVSAVPSCPAKPSACREKETGTGEILRTKGNENSEMQREGIGKRGIKLYHQMVA